MKMHSIVALGVLQLLCNMYCFGADCCKGDARTQSPTTKNCASEPPTFGEIAGFNLAKCNAQVSTRRNRLLDHGIPYAR